ncbi:MAG: AraC family transcriptional regulator [Rubrivivax sp.]|nr:MAG: AraC family transcriptional regulator [Rubrivivax sp.]
MPSSRPIHVNAPRTLNVAYARVVIDHLQRVKPALSQALDARQLSFLDQQDPMARCSLQEWHVLLNRVEGLVGSRDLVPELADQFKPWHAGLLGFTLMTSGTVGELGGLLQRFHHLLNDVFVVDRGVSGSRFSLQLRPATSEHSLRLARLSLCVWAQRLRWLTSRPDLVLDASFEGPPPGDMAPYRRIFGGSVRFDQDSNTLWGDTLYSALPIVSRDTASHSLLQGQALKQLEHLSRGQDPLIDQLQSLIRARLNLGKVTLEDMAAELKMPTRTLQRRLEEAGLNFRLMADDVRQSQARYYLRDTTMALAEMASALGFADHASFNRAFKRWTGLSPGAFRRSQGPCSAAEAMPITSS